MRFFKYLIFTILSAFSINAFAITYSVQSYGGSYATPQAACASFTSQSFSTYTYPGWPEVVGTCGGKFILTVGTCAPTVSTKPISVPGWTNWTIEEEDAYSNSIANVTVCSAGCRYKDPMMSGTTGSDMMNLVLGSPVPDSSCPASTEQPDTPPPNTPTKPPIQCSGDYCAQPQANSCPAGYTTQSFNNQNYCVKDGTPPLSPSNPPSSGNGFDAQGIINAVNNAATSIKNALSTGFTSVTNALSTGFTSVTNALGITNQKLDAANAKLDTGNGHLNDIKNNTNATNQKLDATNQKLDSANAKLDEIDQNGKDGNGHLNDIKNNTNATNQKLDATNQKLDATNQKLDGVKDEITETNSILDDLKNWFKNDSALPAPESSDIEQHQLGDYEKSYVQWNSSCPPDIQVPVNLMGQSSTLSLSWSPWCQLLAKLRWAIIACAYFSAAYIILGMR